jgi:hypothetical protein
MIVLYLEATHDIWLKLCNTYEGSSEKSHLVRTLTIDNIKPLLKNLETL